MTVPNIADHLPVVFGAIAVLFLCLSAQDYFRNNRKMTIAARVRFRIALIFAAVALFLFVLRGTFR